MEKKQSSVEWFAEMVQTYIIDRLHIDGQGTALFTIEQYKEQAKAMHKEEYIDAWMRGDNDSAYSNKELKKLAEQDYNETYNS